MIRVIAASLIALALVLPAVVPAAEPQAALERYFTEVETLSGAFQQTVRDEDGSVLEESRGTFAIQRPDRFDWVYAEPFEQRIVGDGQRLWIHDPGLDQVTVQPIEQELGSGPATLLSGDMDRVTDAFSVNVDGDWVELTPRNEDWQLESARLRLSDGVPQEVIVQDGLGQRTRLELDDLETGVSFDDERFRFEPDDDTDVIEQGAGAVDG
ncbi:MAG: outer membrane lipoprotein chaperone LolA [Ectothiorhodospiraceae bacterium]